MSSTGVTVKGLRTESALKSFKDQLPYGDSKFKGLVVWAPLPL